MFSIKGGGHKLISSVLLLIPSKAVVFLQVSLSLKVASKMEYTKQIITDDGTVVLAFQGGWCFFSNCNMTPFSKFGTRYNSLHQYLQSKKAAHFEDDKTHDAIMNSKSAREQSELATDIKGFNAEEWAKVEEKHVRAGLNAKLAKHLKILQALKGTGDAVIAECGRFDNDWGTGLDIHSPLMKQQKMWGKNRLGEMLMEFRRDGVDIPF